MKSLICLALFLCSITAHSAVNPLNAPGQIKVAHAVFDVSAGTNGSSAAAHGLGVYLPSRALITRSYIYVETALVGSGNKVAYHCEDANNIKTATDMTGSAAGAFIEGASTGAVSAAVAAIADQCEITATLTVQPLTAGKHHVYVEYTTY